MPHRSLMLWLIPLLLLACGDPLQLPKSTPLTEADPLDPQYGKLALALQTEGDAGSYQLANARFDVTGPESTTLEPEAGDRSGTLAVTLPVGEYQVTLVDGWQLLDGSGEQTDAQVRHRTLPFRIDPDLTTPIQFEFEVAAVPSANHGTLSVSIAVTPKASRAVIFNELMLNPAAISDASGEWIELLNVGSEAVELEGCVLSRDASQFTFDTPQTIASGGLLTIAVSSTPGFTPDRVFTSLSLPNSSDFTLRLICGTETLDQVTVVASTWPKNNGASLSLTSDRATANDNDEASAWCLGTSAYATDLGTPGDVNGVCPAP